MKNCAIALGALLVVMSLGASPSKAEVIEQIAATVNDEAIFLSEIRTRAAPYLPQVFQAPTDSQRLAGLRALYDQVLERLIDRELIRQAAVREQIRISSSEVDEALQNMRRQSRLSDEDFQTALAQEGMSLAQYRREMRQQLLRLRVVNQRVRGRVNISEEDVRTRYEQARTQAARISRFQVSHIFVAEGSTGEQAPEAVASAIHSRLDAGDLSFEEAVTEAGGGSLGWLNQGDLPSALEAAITDLAAGDYSSPTQGPAGVHIFMLHERQQGDAQIAPYSEMRPAIYRELLDTAMQQQEAIFLSELREDAMVNIRIASN